MARGWRSSGTTGCGPSWSSPMPMAAASECSRAAMYRRFPVCFIVGNPPVRPAWSPDGRTIALYEIGEFDPRVVFVDVATGAETIREARGGFQPRGLPGGPASLVLSQPEEEGQRIQLWRMSYPDGAVSPLTNDLTAISALISTAHAAAWYDAPRDANVAGVGTLRESAGRRWSHRRCSPGGSGVVGRRARALTPRARVARRLPLSGPTAAWTRTWLQQGRIS